MLDLEGALLLKLFVTNSLVFLPEVRWGDTVTVPLSKMDWVATKPLHLEADVFYMSTFAGLANI